ncbi:MAG: tetratricopeptide repeat protein [Myxococcota bacterium]
MESPKARLKLDSAELGQVGETIQRALQEETHAAEDIRIARAELLHAVTHAELPRQPRGVFALLLHPRVLASFVAPIAAMAIWLFYVTRPISFSVGPSESSSSGHLGDVVEAAASESLPLNFSEGSSVMLERGGRARVLSADSSGARVLLESGAAEVSITHRVGRTAHWHVEAGPFRVLVTGTRFRVAWDPAAHALDLKLHEGSVVVTSRCLDARGSTQIERSVFAGESVSLSCPAASDGLTSNEPAASAAVGEAAPSAGIEPSADAPLRAPPRAEPARSESLDAYRKHLSAGQWADAIQAAERADFARVVANAPQGDLLQLADAARLSGRAARAVQALNAVRQRFPGSNEAATAAFALGRIAFDQRKAYAEAARWFSAYLAEQPNGPLMGDAFGRLMEAHERQGDTDVAKADAERYLRRFPQGPYAPEARRILAN